MRKKCFGDDVHSLITYAISLSQFRWLGHVLRMQHNRLPHRALHCTPGSEWRRQAGGQLLTWQKVVKNKARQLGCVGRIRLPGWGPRDPSHLWLDTLKDMAANRSQWRECCFLVAESVARQR